MLLNLFNLIFVGKQWRIAKYYITKMFKQKYIYYFRFTRNDVCRKKMCTFARNVVQSFRREVAGGTLASTVPTNAARSSFFTFSNFFLLYNLDFILYLIINSIIFNSIVFFILIQLNNLCLPMVGGSTWVPLRPEISYRD